MKPARTLAAILAITFTFSASGTRAELPVRGLHVMAPGKDDLALCERFIREALPKEGVNTLVIEFDYSFQFRSHPELAQPGAMDRADVRQLAKACREVGVQLIPELNCLGHQSWKEQTGALLRKYPHFDEAPGATNRPGFYCRSWCPQAPGLHEIVFDLLDELAEACEAKAVHCGMDEVFVIADNDCPRCRGKDPAALFANEVLKFRDHLRRKGRTMWIWGDRLLDGNATGIGEWEAATNGTHAAVDKLPKDIVICDWHYEQAWATPGFFAKKNFKVLACPWRKSNVALAQLKLIRDARGLGVLQTTWVGFRAFARAYFGEGEKDNQHAAESAACFRVLCAAWRDKKQ